MDAKRLYDEYMITSMLSSIEPVVVDRAAGCTVCDESGKQFIDCFSGIAVCNAGHGHPKVLAAAKKQMEKLVHCCTYVYYNPKAGELGKKLAEVTPGKLKKSFFGNSGAEAVEGAMRLAKQHTHRKEVVCLSRSFHGRTAATLSITGNRGRKKGSGPYLSGVAFAPTPYCYRCPFKLSYPHCGVACAEYIQEVLEYNTAGDVAAFIAEPVMGEGGIIPLPNEYLKIAIEIIHKDGALFIADEVQSGFGRTGKLFAIEHYGVEPDLMCLAKGIADGFPISAFITTVEIAEAFTPGVHLSTFGGNPVSCAAAIANIEVMVDDRLPEHAEAQGRIIMGSLLEVSEKCTLIGDVRGKGLMIGIELVKDEDKTPASEEATQVRNMCRENGVLVGLGGQYANVVRIQPPLVINDNEVGKTLDVLKKCLLEVDKTI